MFINPICCFVRVKYILLFFLSLFNIAVYAQAPLQNLGEQLNFYGIKTQSPQLFIHFDKNVYTNNEAVWFTAYLLGADYAKYNLLSLALVKDADRSIVLENKFMLKNGVAFGNTTIPDSTGPGDYTFIATTNRLLNNRPEVIFSQPVTIKSADQPSYTASLNVLDTGVTVVSQKIMLLVSFNGMAKPPASVPGTWYLGNIAKPVLQGFIKTRAGQYIFNLPTRVLSPGNNMLHVQLNYKNEARDLSLNLPVAPGPAMVNFYPEGGNPVMGIRGTIGFETRTAAGNPLGATAFLYENGHIIDTLLTDRYGFGKLSLKPQPNSAYTLRLYANAKDTAYVLPTALTQGPALAISHALVNDTLSITITDNKQETLYLVGHNYKQLYFISPVSLNHNDKRIKLVLKGVPKGLMQLTLTDSIGRPFAERTVFAHYDQRTPTIITTDKDTYKPREKVTVTIKLDSPVPDSGYVSVACVQENRISSNKRQDIESWFYLKNDLGELPARDSYLANADDKDFLEEVLLIKGWSRYKWTDVLKAKPRDTLKKYTDMVLGGSITLFDRPLNKAVNLVNLNNPLRILTTDATGRFTINDNKVLLVDSGRKALFMVAEPKPKDYQINLQDPYADINEMLAAGLNVKDYNQQKATTQYTQLSPDEHAIQLKEVKIRGNNNDFLYDLAATRKLQVADVFTVSSRERRDGLVYYVFYSYLTVGPKNYELEMDGINTAREFYPADHPVTDLAQSQYLSTLYWKHQVKVSSLKESELTFYTGDIAGSYKIVVQGVITNDVTYGETTFINKTK